MRACSSRKLCCAVLMALVAGTVWLVPWRARTISGLSSEDVIQIRHALRKEVWQDFLPISALHLQKQLASRVWAACRARIEILGPQPDGHVHANVVYPREVVMYGLARQSNHWTIAGMPLVIARPQSSDGGERHNLWVQATLDYAFCRFLSRWPSAPDPARSVKKSKKSQGRVS
jgi:hypothetical protein